MNHTIPKIFSLLLIAVMVVFNFVAASSQTTNCNYEKLLRQGDEFFTNGIYEKALNKYFAARTCNPVQAQEVEERLARVFQSIEEKRMQAEYQKTLAELEKDKIKILNKEIQQSRHAYSNARTAYQIAKSDPTLAIRMINYNYGHNQTELGIGLALEELFKDTTHSYYKTVFNGHREAVVSVTFSSDDAYILTGGRDNRAMRWKVADGRFLNAYEGHNGYVNAAVFSPDSEQLLTGSQDGTVKIWSPEGAETYYLDGHLGDVFDIAFSPDGQLILTASRDNTAILWSKSGQFLHRFQEKDAIETVDFSPDGKFVALGSWDYNAYIYLLENKKRKATLSGHTGHIYKVKFTPDSQNILTGSRDQTARLWDLKGETQKKFIGHTGAIYGADISKDGKYILTGSRDKTAKLWSTDGAEIRTYRGHSDVIYDVAFSNDGESIVTGSKDGTARIWKTHPNPPGAISTHTDAVYAVAFSPDGNYVLTGSRDFTGILWTIGGKPERKFRGHKDAINSVAFSPSGDTIITGSWDDSMLFWRIDENRPVATHSRHRDDINAVSYSPNGRYVLTGSRDSTALLQNLHTSEVIQVKHTSDVTHVTFAPDGQSFLTASRDKTARRWSTATGDLLSSFTAHAGYVYAVAFSPDGQHVLTGGWDNKARLWNVYGDTLVTLEGHTGYVSAVAFSPDGRYVLTGSRDNTAKLWDLEGDLIRTFSGHQGFISSVAFSPDSQFILTGSWDNTARLWTINGAPVRIFGIPSENIGIMHSLDSDVRNKFQQNFEDKDKFIREYVAEIGLNEMIVAGLIPTDADIRQIKSSSDTLIIMKLADNLEKLQEYEVAYELWELPQVQNTIAGTARWYECGLHLGKNHINDLLKKDDPDVLRYLTDYFYWKGDNVVANRFRQALLERDQTAYNWIEIDENYGVLKTNDPEVLLYHYLDYYNKKDTLNAKRFSDKLVEINDWNSLLSASKYLYRKQRLDEARRFAVLAYDAEDNIYTRLQTYVVHENMGKENLDLLLATEEESDLIFYKNYFTNNAQWGPDHKKVEEYQKAILFWEKIIERYDRQEYRSSAADTYNNLGWFQLLNADFTNSEQSILRGLELDDSELYLWTNRPHNLLFKGEIEAAKALYLEKAPQAFYPNTRFPSFREAYLDDFKNFERRGIIPVGLQPIVEEIKAMLLHKGDKRVNN